MPLTVRDLLSVPGLGLTVVAGAAGLDRPIRWVHTSELQDPTPWLSGGELLLTTGMGLAHSGALQRAYIRRLVGAGLAGLGFGVGFGFDAVPSSITRAAERDGFPVLEVPYPVPFIAIAEAVSSRLAEERVRDAQASVEVHERLAALVSHGAGPADVLDEVVALAGGWALVFDRRGAVVAGAGVDAPDPAAAWAALPDGIAAAGALSASDVAPRGTTVALAVVVGGRREGVLLFGKDARLDAHDRMVVHHAVTVLGVLLSARRAVADAERRIAGDLLTEAFGGRVPAADLVRRLELAGFAPDRRVAVVVVDGVDPAHVPDAAWLVDAALGPGVLRSAVVGGRVAALVADDDPERLARAVLDELDAQGRSVGIDPGAARVGVGDAVEPRDVRSSYLTASFALRATDRRVASPRDLGSYALLLGAQPRPVLEGYVRSILGPLLERDRRRSSELVASVRAFVEAGGRWEPGAEALGVHRHTLRYRVRQAEELLGRDLSRAEDRLEVWLALRAADVLDA
ncbi:MAG TPA: PucR family transcriptional regulator ligand-binding domain-containing protein [Actinomycetota bacterium]|nr:PucR family transcriptional regulator ligand-binding domain-containing protein [Actinomycetota bacterium]